MAQRSDYTIRHRSGPISDIWACTWDVLLSGETLFQSTLAELDQKVSQHMNATLLNEQRANLIGLIQSRAAALSVGAGQKTATVESYSASPTPKGDGTTDYYKALASRALSNPDPYIQRIGQSLLQIFGSGSFKKERETKMAEVTSKKVVTALYEDFRSQLQHYQRLGAGKPDDHEYNVLAKGYETVINEEGALKSYIHSHVVI